MSALRTAMQGLTQNLMVAAGDRGQKKGADQAEKYFSEIAQLDYASKIGQRFDRSQIRELLADLRRSLPALNRNVFRETNLTRLTSAASELGVTLRAEALPGEGLGIRGFYLNDSAFSSRPLIVVNAANPPLTVAAAFWHEIGHHLTYDIFGAGSGRLNLTFSSSYQDHLDDPKELLADIVMTLAAYPAATAKRLFGASKLKNDPQGLVDLVAKASNHVRAVSGFGVSKGGPLKKKLHMLASMIHIARLRAALLEGYGI